MSYDNYRSSTIAQDKVVCVAVISWYYKICYQVLKPTQYTTGLGVMTGYFTIASYPTIKTT